MKLVIQEDFVKDLVDDTTNVPISMLEFKSTHIFIAGTHWESVTITLTDAINPESLHYIPTVTDTVNVKLPREMTRNMMCCLCELYPEKAGAIRQSFMTKGNIQKVIESAEFTD